jgi:hypothetical protein
VLQRPVEPKLAALIRMVDHVRRTALRERHVQGIEHELSPQVRCHRPADDAAAPRVENDGEVQEAGPGRDVRDVGDPELIGSGRGEVALDEVRRGPRVLRADRRARPLAATHADQAGCTHQARDPLAAHVHALSCQLRVHPRHAVRAA